MKGRERKGSRKINKRGAVITGMEVNILGCCRTNIYFSSGITNRNENNCSMVDKNN